MKKEGKETGAGNPLPMKCCILYIPLEEDRLVSVFRREQNKDLLLHCAALSHERTWNWKEK